MPRCRTSSNLVDLRQADERLHSPVARRRHRPGGCRRGGIGPARGRVALRPSVRSRRSALIGGAALRQGPAAAARRDARRRARVERAFCSARSAIPAFDRGDSSRRPETALLAIRRELQLYANLRPAKVWAGLEDAGPLKTTGGRRHRHAGRPRADRRALLRRAARDCGRRQFRAQHDAVLAAGDRAHRAPRVRRRPRRRQARHVGRQGQCARDIPAVAAGRRRAVAAGLSGRRRSTTCSSIRARCGSRSRRRASTSS